MRSYFATLRQLVLPAGSPPGSPAVVIGADMPPALTQFYAAQSRRIVGGIIMRTDARNLVYDVLLVSTGVGLGAPQRAVGVVDSVNGAAEQYWVQFVGAGARMTSTGDHVFNGLVTFAGSAQFNGTASFTETRFSGRSQGRGLIAYADSAVASGLAIAEVGTLSTGTNVPMTPGRVYEIRVWGHYLNSGGTVGEAVVRVRQGGTSGPLLVTGHVETSAAGWFSRLIAGKVRVDTASLSGPWLATVQQFTGPDVNVFASAAQLRTLEVWDVGAVADFGGIAGNLPLVQP